MKSNNILIKRLIRSLDDLEREITTLSVRIEALEKSLSSR